MYVQIQCSFILQKYHEVVPKTIMQFSS